MPPCPSTVTTRCVLATASVHLGNKWPFGNANSHADENGHLYFYVSNMDASMQDVAVDPRVSFTLSEAQKPGMCIFETQFQWFMWTAIIFCRSGAECARPETAPVQDLKP